MADSPAEDLQAWLAAPDGAAWNEFWKPEGELSAYDRFHAAVLIQQRTDPRIALEAVERVGVRDRRRLIPLERGRLLRLRAGVLGLNGRYGDASRIYQRAWGILSTMGNPREQGAAGIGWVTVLTQMARYDEGLRVARQTARVLRRGEAAPRARLAANEAILLMLSGRLEEAVVRFRDARRRLKRAGFETDAHLVAYNLGRTLIALGRHRPAERVLEPAAAHFGQLGARSMELYARTALGLATLGRGAWTEGLQALETLKSDLESLEDARAVATIQRDVSETLFAVGILSRAESLAQDALRAYQGLEMAGDEARTAFLHARVLAALGRRLDARVRFRHSLRYWESVGDRRSAHRAELELARATLRRGDVADAQRLLSRIRKRSPAVRSGTRVAERLLVAQLRLAQGRNRLSARAARDAYEATRRQPLHPDRPRIALALAEALHASGESGLALRWTRRAVKEMERLYVELGAEFLGDDLGTARDSILRRAVDLVLSMERPGSAKVALDLLSRARSPRLIEDLLIESRGMDASLRTAVAKLRDELLGDPGAGPDDVRSAHLRTTMRSLQKQLGRQRSTSRGLFRRAWERRGLEAWAHLLKDDNLVYYDRDRSGWSAFVLERGRVRHVRLPEAADRLRDDWVALSLLFNQAAHLSSVRRRRFLAATEAEARRALVRLREALWDPLAVRDAPTHLIPVESLQAVPLEAAIETAVGEHASVTRWPHPAVLGRRRRPHEREALLLHDGRAETRTETRRIAGRLRRAGLRVRSGSRRRDISRNARLGVLHIAAHGTFHRRQWLLSGVELADGWIGFEQLAEARIDGGLVVFGSCESGLVTEEGTSDWDGWMSAALGAGAKELVMTLWKVDDASVSGFTERFYREWIAGTGASTAAAAARRELRRGHPHPYVWAPFFAVG